MKDDARVQSNTEVVPDLMPVPKGDIFSVTQWLARDASRQPTANT